MRMSFFIQRFILFKCCTLCICTDKCCFFSWLFMLDVWVIKCWKQKGVILYKYYFTHKPNYYFSRFDIKVYLNIIWISWKTIVLGKWKDTKVENPCYNCFQVSVFHWETNTYFMLQLGWWTNTSLIKLAVYENLLNS